MSTWPPSPPIQKPGHPAPDMPMPCADEVPGQPTEPTPSDETDEDSDQ